MAEYTAADVKALRERTGAGMLDCKVALTEAHGDVEQAIVLLRERGLKGVAKRAGRATTAGLIAAAYPEEGSVGKLDATLIELACETDFVAKTERFTVLAHTVLGGVAIDADPWAPESATQGWIQAAAAQLGEKIELRRVKRVKGEKFATYLHRTSRDLPPQVGVILGYRGGNAEAARHIAQHIAAAEPQYIWPRDIPQAEIDGEEAILTAAARAEGKPEAVIEKIVLGKLAAYVKRLALMNQPFTRDSEQDVRTVAETAGLELLDFARLRVGE